MTPADRLRRIEEKRAALVARMRDMPETVRTTRPAPDKWSIQEIVEHLVLAEEATLGRARKSGGRTRSLRDRFMYVVVMGILRFDVPVRVPSRSMVPGGTVGLDELAERWKTSHRELRERLEAGPAGLDGTPFSHPVSGPMSVSDALHMLEVHLDRHARQIEKIAGGS